MRAIDIDAIERRLPKGWATTASTGDARIRAKYAALFVGPGRAPSAGERDPRRAELSTIVKDQQAVWQNPKLKAVLMDASDGKCWYCEAHVEQRADNAVDHYRPKNRVAEAQDHHGYFWLACEWRNYRFACTFCNSARNTEDTSGGKQDHFKLWNEDHRARDWTHPLHKEQPLLLDPCEPADVAFITFDPDGTPVPAISKEDNAYLNERARESIHRYHLHRPEFNKLRWTLMSKALRLLKEADEFRPDVTGTDVTADAAYKQKVRDLAGMLRPSAEFSAAVRAAVSLKRGTSQTARALELV